jgi:hypothetical protein
MSFPSLVEYQSAIGEEMSHFGNGHAITDRPNIAISTSTVLAKGAEPHCPVFSVHRTRPHFIDNVEVLAEFIGLLFPCQHQCLIYVPIGFL